MNTLAAQYIADQRITELRAEAAQRRLVRSLRRQNAKSDQRHGHWAGRLVTRRA